MDEQNPQQQGKTDPTAAPAPNQPAPRPDPTATSANAAGPASATPPREPDVPAAGGPFVPPAKPAAPAAIDPRREEAIAHVMTHGNTREEAEKVVAALGVDRILEYKATETAGESDPEEEAEEEELPEGAEHMKKCTGCGTWATKGELQCPQCSTPFPVERG